jgi:hypothetical protein
MQRAAVRLALTPVLDLEGLLAKIRVAQEHELGELAWMTQPVLEVLANDVRRLSLFFPFLRAARRRNSLE